MAERMVSPITVGSLLGLVGACIATVLLHLPLSVYPLGRDQGAWLTGGMALNHGKVYFRDFIYFDLPGVSTAYALALNVMDNPRWAVTLVAAVGSVLTVIAVFLLVRETVSQRAAHWAAWLFACSWPVITNWWAIAHKDYLGMSWVLIGTWCAACSTREIKHRWTVLFLCGFFVGIAMEFKPTHGIVLPLLALALAVDAAKNGREGQGVSDRPKGFWRKARQWALQCGVLALGTVVSFLPLLLYLIVEHAVKDAFESLWVIGPAYMGLYRSSVFRTWENIGTILSYRFPLPLLATAAAGAAITMMPRINPRGYWLIVPGFAALGGYLVQGRGWEYHFHPMMVMIYVYAGVAMGFAWRRRAVGERTLTWAARLACAVLFGVAVAYWAVVALTQSRYVQVEVPAWMGNLPRKAYLTSQFHHDLDYPNPHVSEQLAAWIDSQTGPDDTIVVWGLECQIYALAHRMYATQAPFHMLLTGKAAQQASAWQVAQRERFMRLIKREPPALFIITTRDANPVQPMPSNALLSRVPGLEEFLRKNYSLAGTFERFIVLKRLDTH